MSYTEAAALRRYATGEDDFIYFEKFAGPVTTELSDGNPSLALPAGGAWWAPVAPFTRGVMVEAAVWPSPAGVVEFALLAANVTVAPPPCNTSVLPATNACPGAAGETNFVVPPSAGDPAGACAAACCARGAACGAWVVLPNTTWDDKSCACAAAPCTCCWLKPAGCLDTERRPGCTAGFPPTPPPLPPPALAGYVVALNFSGAALTLSRAPAGGGARTLLGAFDLAGIENGRVNGWSLLRVALREGGGLDVWFNPMLKETGVVGNSSDAERLPHAPAPRISVVDASGGLPAGGLAIAASEPARVDYVSILPLSVL